MNIAYYMPFKPLGHSNPSGDLVTGTELYNFLGNNGHQIELVSQLRCRWIYLKPWVWPRLFHERNKALQNCRLLKPDIWLSYHSYYKAPDMLGPDCSRRMDIPYALFQGVYSTKRKRTLKTLPGFLLNRRALLSAKVVFTNKKGDERNLRRLLPQERVVYVPPGIQPTSFTFDPVARRELRKSWKFAPDHPVILTAAMFRPGVKTDGICGVIDASERLISSGIKFKLVIAGDGANREILEQQAKKKIPGAYHFTGRVKREEMYRYYSASDIFAFPGFQESLGMVYLEAQSCGLPVVAFKDWGASEVVIHERTGLLGIADQRHTFAQYIEQLLLNKELRRIMGEEAARHVRNTHDLAKNYRTVETVLSNTRL